MKVKTIKAHYYENIYRPVGSVYRADKKHIAIVVSRGICEEVKSTRPNKKDLSNVLNIEDKSNIPKTKKKRKPSWLPEKK